MAFYKSLTIVEDNIQDGKCSTTSNEKQESTSKKQTTQNQKKRKDFYEVYQSKYTSN